MAILDLYKKEKPLTGKANTTGGDPEPIGDVNKFRPSKNLSRDQKALKKARGGEVNSKLYSATPRK